MNKIDSFKKFQSKFIPLIDQFIEDYYDQKINMTDKNWLKTVYMDIKEFCLRDGKRIRPLMLLIGYYGYCEESANVNEDDIVKIASVLEIMHSFLLIHDDIVDKAQMRRGKKAMHVLNELQFSAYTKSTTVGNDVALIAGDMMAVECLGIISEIDLESDVKNRFLKYFSETYTNTARGQILDIIYSLPKNIEDANNIPYEISEYKTSFYTISYPLIMGYTISGKKNENEIKSIMDFAKSLGLCFQFRDDLLGVFANDDKIGKSSNSDIEEGKYTFLIQHAIQQLNDKDRNKFISLFLKTNKSQRNITKIKRYLEKTETREFALNKIEELGKDSMEKMKNIKIGDNIKSVLNDVVSEIMKVTL